MSNLEHNCVVRAISILAGVSPSEALAWLQSDTLPSGAPIIDEDGAELEGYAQILFDRGWHIRVPQRDQPFSIPHRAMVVIPGHVFVHDRGRFFGMLCGHVDPTPIRCVLIPPDATKQTAEAA